MKRFRFLILILLVFVLAGCDAYYQAQTAQAEATAAPYDSAARIAEAQSQVQIAGLDTQRQIAAIQATAQSEQAGLLVTQTSKSLAILENAANRQVELIEAQYRTMQLNAWILIIAGSVLLAVCAIVIAWMAIRARRGETEIRREIVYLTDPLFQAPGLIIPRGEVDEIQPLPTRVQLPVMRQRRREW